MGHTEHRDERDFGQEAEGYRFTRFLPEEWHKPELASEADALRPLWRLRFPSGEWFVDNEDLHLTAYSVDSSQATAYPSAATAAARRDAMMMTQGVKLVVEAPDSATLRNPKRKSSHA